jgi:hypothetical protein
MIKSVRDFRRINAITEVRSYQIYGCYLYHPSCTNLHVWAFLIFKLLFTLAWVNSDWRWHDRRPFMAFWPSGMMSWPKEHRVMLSVTLSSDLIWPSNLLSNKCPKILINAGIFCLGPFVVVCEIRALRHSMPRSPRNHYEVLYTIMIRGALGTVFEVPTEEQPSLLGINFFPRSRSLVRTGPGWLVGPTY